MKDAQPLELTLILEGAGVSELFVADSRGGVIEVWHEAKAGVTTSGYLTPALASALLIKADTSLTRKLAKGRDDRSSLTEVGAGIPFVESNAFLHLLLAETFKGVCQTAHFLVRLGKHAHAKLMVLACVLVTLL